MEKESSIGETCKNNCSTAKIYTYLAGMYDYWSRTMHGPTLMINDIKRIIPEAMGEPVEIECIDDFRGVSLIMGVPARFKGEFGISARKTPNSAQYFAMISDIKNTLVKKVCGLMCVNMSPLFPKTENELQRQGFSSATFDFVMSKINTYVNIKTKKIILYISK